MMTVKELLKILEDLAPDYSDYKITTEDGHKAFDGDVFIDKNYKIVIIE